MGPSLKLRPQPPPLAGLEHRGTNALSSVVSSLSTVVILAPPLTLEARISLVSIHCWRKAGMPVIAYKKLKETVKPGKSSRFHTGDIAIVDNGQELKTLMTSRLFRACRT